MLEQILADYLQGASIENIIIPCDSCENVSFARSVCSDPPTICCARLHSLVTLKRKSNWNFFEQEIIVI